MQGAGLEIGFHDGHDLRREAAGFQEPQKGSLGGRHVVPIGSKEEAKETSDVGCRLRGRPLYSCRYRFDDPLHCHLTTQQQISGSGVGSRASRTPVRTLFTAKGAWRIAGFPTTELDL